MDGSSSTSTGHPRPSFLKRTLEQLSSRQYLKLPQQEEGAESVAVIAVQRYLREQSEEQSCEKYSYDVTITDGVWRAKCFLHPSLNHLVHINTLRTGTDIIITQCSLVYNERRVGHGYISIEKLRCGTRRSAVLSNMANIRDVSALPMLVKHSMEPSTLLQSDMPLQVSRKHYLPLWNNDDPVGDMWTLVPTSRAPVLDVSKISLLHSLESSFRGSSKTLPLLVRIMQKSRLRYYGKMGTKIEFPYQAYFEVADQSGTMSLVLWNELCPQFYLALKVGTVMYLQNYSLKQSYSNRSHPQMDHYGMKKFTAVEICLNPRNPASVITIVPPKEVQPQWSLPDLSYRFTKRSELGKFANNSACDIIGLVTFVGRVERIKSKGNNEKYWTFRWVHAVDGTSEQPFILEIFSSSQPEMFVNISPMTYLVCTQMRVCQAAGSSLYLTSSCETEMFITGYHKRQPYVNDPSVKEFIQWTKTQKDNVILQRSYVGGHYSYPHAPPTFTQPVAETSEQVPLVAVSDLKKELETLQYREHKKLAIQGQITAVRYVEKSSMTEAQGPGWKEMPDLTAAEQARLDVQETALCVSTLVEPPTVSKRKRTIQTRNAKQSSASSVPPKRSPQRENTEVGEPDEEAGESHLEEHNVHSQIEGCDVLSWESSGWPRQRQEVSEHLHHGALRQDSISRRFTLDKKNALLCWSNLDPMQWTPEQLADAVPPAVCPGYYQVTILGINKRMAVDVAFLPVVCSSEHRAVGLICDRHDNTMMSCLSSGFLSPLSNSEATGPRPEEILTTASELEDTHLVCVLDICHLGGEELEVLISKVYKVTEVSVL
ncbi:RPA-related protein RADX isoform X2 [Dunckerocampus dactyliophorus]|uniref:RPA-related protein RADX isoform X2 n=1 Tax=Dunckerocampus dactyliophorus TaxID=161453 RepID=UPI002405F4CB|nr:RPA-related protein RADX isoform X2 [Dunckerocampus dactyliophorus]